MEEFDEFLEYIDIVEEENNRERIRKRYIRDADNPMEFFNENEFRARYRFFKNTKIQNRKGFFSLNVQVVSGPNREILDIVVRHPGSNHDSVIFDRSAVRVRMERGDIPGLLLGDNGYACRHYLLTPLVHAGTEEEERYNRAHRRTRNVVERLFGICKRRFPCLQRGLQTKLETSVAIICATAVLYNIGLREHEYFEENEDFPNEVEPVRFANDFQRGLDFRRQFIQQHFGQ